MISVHFQGKPFNITVIQLSASVTDTEEAEQFYEDLPDHLVKKEFIGPGLHLRPVHADHAWPPFQWTLNSVFSAYENNNRRIRPPPDRGTLKIVSRLLIA